VVQGEPADADGEGAWDGQIAEEAGGAGAAAAAEGESAARAAASATNTPLLSMERAYKNALKTQAVAANELKKLGRENAVLKVPTSPACPPPCPCVRGTLRRGLTRPDGTSEHSLTGGPVLPTRTPARVGPNQTQEKVEELKKALEHEAQQARGGVAGAGRLCSRSDLEAMLIEAKLKNAEDASEILTVLCMASCSLPVPCLFSIAPPARHPPRPTPLAALTRSKDAACLWSTVAQTRQ